MDIRTRKQDGDACFCGNEQIRFPRGLLYYLDNDRHDDTPPVALDLSKQRTLANKYSYSFCIKWRNYEEPSWVKYAAIKDTSTFAVWKAAHPVLKF